MLAALVKNEEERLGVTGLSWIVIKIEAELSWEVGGTTDSGHVGP